MKYSNIKHGELCMASHGGETANAQNQLRSRHIAHVHVNIK